MIKKVIAFTIIIIAVLSIYFGSYLPLIKAQRYITAITSASSIRTLEDFEKNFDRPFKFYSPIGDEEIAKFLSNDILGMVSSVNQQERVDRAVVEYIEPYMFQNDVRHLMAIGRMYVVLWEKYGRKEEDFKRAESYYQKAFAIGPKLPPVLYGMLDLYRLKGNLGKVKEIGEIILKYWPDDKNIENIVSSL